MKLLIMEPSPLPIPVTEICNENWQVEEGVNKIALSVCYYHVLSIGYILEEVLAVGSLVLCASYFDLTILGTCKCGVL